MYVLSEKGTCIAHSRNKLITVPRHSSIGPNSTILDSTIPDLIILDSTVLDWIIPDLRILDSTIT